MKTKDRFLQQLKSIEKMKLVNINFVRGLGLVEPRFELSFANQTDSIVLEVETNIRIRTRTSHLLSFNDLYLNQKRKTISVKMFRQQKNIEKTYLFEALNCTNAFLKNKTVNKVVVKEYGDIFIKFSSGTTIEVFNDTHMQDATLYRIITNGNFKEVLKCYLDNNILKYTYTDLDFQTD